MRKLSSIAAAAGVLLMLAGDAAAQQQKISLTIAAGQAPRGVVPLAMVTEVFIPEVERRIKDAGLSYEINWREAYAGSLLKPLQMLDGIQNGVADIGFIPTLFYPRQLALDNISYAIPFASSNVMAVSNALNHLHETFPEFAAQYHNFNQIRLGGNSYDSYELLTTFPVRKAEDVKGRKIGTAGAALQWLRGTGATPVSSNMMEYFNSTSSGVYDGFIVFGSAIPGMKYAEAAPHVTKAGFGAHHGTVLTINRDTYNKLPEDLRKILQEAGKVWGLAADKAMQEAGNQGLASVASVPKGELFQLPREEQEKWANAMPNIAKEWAEGVEKEGLPGTKALAAYMDSLRKQGESPVRDWDKN